jgi:HEAT repeat protein
VTASVAVVIALSLTVVFLALQVMIVIVRFRADRRRRRVEELRPGIETALAVYVADPESRPPELPDSELGRLVVREVALEAIAELRGREGERLTELLEETGAIDELCDDLADKSPVTRRHAAEALGELRSPISADGLLFGVRDPDRDSRLACARALAELGDGRYTKPVLDAADEAAESRPGAAAAVLLSVGMRDPAGLAYALEPGRSAACRRLAAGVVAELRLAEHAPLLRAALSDGDDELATRAARGLGAIGDFDAVDTLLEVVEGDERPWFCRAVAAGALGAIGDPRAVPALESLLKTEDRWLMRDRAAAALSRLGEDGQVALGRALESSAPEVRKLAMVALES